MNDTPNKKSVGTFGMSDLSLNSFFCCCSFYVACPVPVCAYLQHIAPCTVHTYLNSNRTAVLYSLASFLQCLLLFFSFIFSASHCTRWCTIIIIMSFRYRFNSNRISHQICVFFWLDLKYLSLSLVWLLLLFGLLLWFVLMDRGDWSTPLDCCNAHCIASRARAHRHTHALALALQ